MAEHGHKQEREKRWHHELHPLVQKHSSRTPFTSTPSSTTTSSSGSLGKGSTGWLHPTRATLKTEDNVHAFGWKSRDHRKNRHRATSPRSGAPRRAESVLRGIVHMGRVEYWNISWVVAILFTLGSIVWVINGFFVFLPLCAPSVVAQNDVAAGWTAWLGATIFEFGAAAGVLEAWNRAEVAEFGWAVDELVKHAHEHANGNGSGKSDKSKDDVERSGANNGQAQDTYTGIDSPATGRLVKPHEKWIWFSMDGRYFHELGFLAAFSQFWAATIFWISGFTALPEVQDAIKDNTPLLDGVFWSPQVVGGSGFIIASLLIMLETQKRWYVPAPASLGWQVGFWNLVGAIGFTLCGALGYGAATNSGVEYQSSLSTFWGGWAFLIGSVIQWYESVNSV